MRGIGCVRGEEVRRRPFRVALSPLASLFMATRDAAGAQRSRTPESWCQSIRAQLTRGDYEILAPLATSEMVFVPDAVFASPTVPGLSLKDELDQVVALADDQLARDIHMSMASGPTGDWRDAERRPERWARGYVAALERAWMGFRPIWQLAQESLARETARVGVATVRDAQLELLDGLLPTAGVSDGQWRVQGHEDVELVFAPTGLVLVPLVAGNRASILGAGDGVMRDLGYPVPALPDRVPVVPPAPPASLNSLLGVQRARLLRALEQPANHQRLADTLHTVASTVTHHVASLEAAGLVVREREGRQILVRRTPRGTALLALYRTDQP